ncbi:MAG TPA: L-2-hydroxyglutarate oxidase [Candidatus Deferrimicrobium sp.]|nr:L-2-hydroxyglutarate oxidase [Candidatus Deferrimicrobium sp.]
MSIERADVAVIGGGIVGLATAYRLLERRPDLRLVVLEAEAELASHQSGHNSGVLHAGLYYQPGSLKARLCREGKEALETFADEHGIPFERCGKLVVALSDAELPRLEALRQRAEANGVPGLAVAGPEQIREIEPMAAGVRALWSPTTGIIDFRRVALAYADEVRARGGTIHVSRAVTGIRPLGQELLLATTTGELVARDVIACAGLQADRVAAMTSDPGTERIVPFRGDYYTLKSDARPLVRGLIYPLADPRFPFLGVHFTKRIDGEVWAGPNAVLALARHGYRRRDVNLRDVLGTIRDPGFLRLARRFWRTGLVEQWRDLSKRAFAAELRRYVPAIRDDQLVFGPSGVRAQALDRDGSLIDDFLLGGTSHVLHVRNAPSPAATASLAIGRELAEAAIERFGLTGPVGMPGSG